MSFSARSFASMHSALPAVENTCELSRTIVVPFYNEAACVEAVLAEIRNAQPSAEIIAVDDGSTDGTWQHIQSRSDVRGLRLDQNCGQSAAIYAGMLHATGSVIVLMDGDGQNDPSDIDVLIAELTHADVVVGYRANRQDKWSRRTASRIANRIRRIFLVDGVRDTGCSLKVFPACCVELLTPFNGLHRYLPAIFNRAGLRIREVPVNHRARTLGKSKYTNWDRAIRGVYDLIGVAWLLRRKIHFPRIQTSHFETHA